MSNDPNDLEAPMANHLLLLKTKPTLPSGVHDIDDIDEDKCNMSQEMGEGIPSLT